MVADAGFEAEHTSPCIGIHQTVVGAIRGRQSTSVRTKGMVPHHVTCLVFRSHKVTLPIPEHSIIRIYDFFAQSLISHPHFIHSVCDVPKPDLASVRKELRIYRQIFEVFASALHVLCGDGPSHFVPGVSVPSSSIAHHGFLELKFHVLKRTLLFPGGRH